MRGISLLFALNYL